MKNEVEQSVVEAPVTVTAPVTSNPTPNTGSNKPAPRGPRRPDKRWEELSAIMAAGTTVTVEVTEIAYKAAKDPGEEKRPCGLSTKLNGLRAFLPSSHVPRGVKFDALVGTKIEVKVIECDPKERGGKLVVSLTAVLDQAKKAFVTGLVDGAEVTGKVVSVVDGLGYFVNLGPVDALLHVSQTPLDDNREPKVFAVGDEVTAKVSSRDVEKCKVGLTMRAPRPQRNDQRGGNGPQRGGNRNSNGGAFGRDGGRPAGKPRQEARTETKRAPVVVSTPAPKPIVRKPTPVRSKKGEFTQQFGSFADLAAHWGVGEAPATEVNGESQNG